MNPRIVIPLRGLTEGKTRLARILSVAEREALIRAMVLHVQAVARQVAPAQVLSGDPGVLALADRPLTERAAGLNPALERMSLELGSTEPIMVVHADLPLLTAADLRAMLALLEHADVVAAPDHRGTGTNALLLASPGLLPYAFGPDSLAAFRDAAERRGLRLALCRRRGLAFDLDTPEDLALLPKATADALGIRATVADHAER